MRVETFDYKCGCPGELRAMYNNYLTNREKAELRRLERSLCPDCYQQKQEDAFEAKWGALPSVSGVSTKQEAYGFKLLLRLLSSGAVRESLGKLVLSKVDLPVGALLDAYNGGIVGKIQAFPGMNGTENLLLTAYPDLRREFFAVSRVATPAMNAQPVRDPSSEGSEPTE